MNPLVKLELIEETLIHIDDDEFHKKYQEICQLIDDLYNEIL